MVVVVVVVLILSYFRAVKIEDLNILIKNLRVFYF